MFRKNRLGSYDLVCGEARHGAKFLGEDSENISNNSNKFSEGRKLIG
jgi:hypothetical protein